MRYGRQVFRLARFRFGRYLLSGLFASTLGYVLPLVPGLIVRDFLDALTSRTPAGLDPTTLLALLVGVAAGRLGVSAGAVFFEESTQLLVAALLRRNVLAHALGQPGARPLPASTGEAISRVRDDVQYVIGFLTWTLDPLGQAAALGIVLYEFVRIDPLMTVVVILPVAVVVGAVRLAARRLVRYRTASQSALGEVTGLLGSVFDGVLAVKAAGAERYVVAYLRVLNDARRRASLNDLVFSQTLRSVAANAGDLGTGVLLLFAAQAMRSGRFTVGDFALVVSYLGWLTMVTSGFGDFLGKVRQAEVSFDRLGALLPNAAPGALSTPAPILPAELAPAAARLGGSSGDRLHQLVVRDLAYRFPDSDRGISGVSFAVRRGELVVITGRVGAGKTTLLRVLLGLLPRDAGDVLWNGEPLRDLAQAMLPPRVGYTPQVPRLFSESLADNLRLGYPATDEVLMGAIARAMLTRDVATFERGLHTLVGARGTRLSGGQVQRAALARALLRDPDLLVVDDLSSALDVATEQLLWTDLLGQTDLTCLAVSHRPAVLCRACRVIVLDDGHLVGQGTVDELLASCPEFQELWAREDSEPVERDGV